MCYNNTGTMGSGETRDFFCTSSLIGQYVSVELINPRMHLGVEPTLTLCEVKVYTLLGEELFYSDLQFFPLNYRLYDLSQDVRSREKKMKMGFFNDGLSINSRIRL